MALGVIGRYPVLGANGSVFFSILNTSDGSSNAMGFDEHTGAITFTDGSAAGQLGAYANGIAITASAGVRYVSYADVTLSSYSTGSAIATANSVAFGADGAVFFAGYDSCGATSHLSVVKITPSGVAWTWTNPTVSNNCHPTSIAATPDGGAVEATDSGNPGPVTFTSVGPSGAVRWTDNPTGPLGPGSYAQPPIVDSNGIVGLPSDRLITCADGVTNTCAAFHIDWVSQTSTAPTLNVFDWADTTDTNLSGSFGDDTISIDSGRVYVVRKINNVTNLYAYPRTGLATSYVLSVQEALTANRTPSNWVFRSMPQPAGGQSPAPLDLACPMSEPKYVYGGRELLQSNLL